MIDIFNGDCLDVLKGLADNSIDSVVTDPPYGLSFMNKHWDYDVPSIEIWREVLRVLKPGGHLLSFGGTRTYHRMVVNIEDAGFEIRDQIQWIYGCLSDDTEILTRHGWVQYRISKEFNTFVDDEILIYDVQNDIYKWEKPERWSEYNIVKDTAYHIQSDNTDQIVSRNHRCLVEREGKLVFICAEELSNVESMPTLSNDILMLPKRRTGLLQSGVQWLLQRIGLGQSGMEGFSCGDTRKEKGVFLKGRKQSCVEGRNNLPTKEGVLCQCEDKVHCMSEGVYSDGTKGRVCDGIQACDGNADAQTIVENRVRSSHRPQSTEQRYNESDVVCIKQGSQTIRGGKTYHTTLATVTPIEYSGIIFCPTVSTGAFVARRNGKIFLTGNSGFPKSLNIGKAIDKTEGVERMVVGIQKHPTSKDRTGNKSPYQAEQHLGSNFDLTKGTSEYEGFGTALKPANEPICMARKPLSEKTVALNVLKWGTGGINIDGCRVEVDPVSDASQIRTMNRSISFFDKPQKENDNPQVVSVNGRFPANVILSDDEEVLSGFPYSTSGAMDSISKGKNYGIYGKYNGKHVTAKASEGSASRFFYCAKASKSERNKGCEDLNDKHFQMRPFAEEGCDMSVLKNRMNAKTGKNNHPTVKPVSLMRYLCRLVTPPKGIVLDPFTGSGTTGIGAKMEGFSFVGIEREEEYCKIARARIDAWEEEKPAKDKIQEPTLF